MLKLWEIHSKLFAPLLKVKYWRMLPRGFRASNLRFFVIRTSELYVESEPTLLSDTGIRLVYAQPFRNSSSSDDAECAGNE